MGDELTVAFAEALLDHERVGRGPATDLLAIGLSCTDYIGHAFGPNSLEAEDNLYRLDRVIARLLSAADRSVGLDRTLIVLTSDHGVDAAPESRCPGLTLEPDADGGAVLLDDPEGCGGGGRHVPQRFIDVANTALRDRFGIDEDLVAAFWNPSVYLDMPAVERLGLNVPQVERTVAAAIAAMPGVELTITRSDLLAGAVPDSPLLHKVRRAFHAERTGNVLIVQKEFWYLYHNPTGFSAMHGSPWPYDTHVPVVIAVPGFDPQRVDRRIGPEDIAPTLAALLNIPPPSGCTGDVLPELVPSQN